MSTAAPSRHVAPDSARRRFWVTVLCFALANLAAWVVYDRVIAYRHRGTLRVDAFEPGDGAVVGARPNVRFHFSADVIPTALYGHDPARITPSIPGRWTWDDPRTLVFTPAADLPRATRVHFALDQQFIRSGTGATLNGPYVAAVDAQPLELLDARQTALEDRDQYILELRFNDRVAPGDVLQHLTMHTAAGRTVTGQLHGEAAGNIVRIRTESVEPDRPDGDTELHLHLAPGVVGLSGPLGIDRDIDQTVNLARALAATDLKAYVPARGQPYLLLSFNNEIDSLALKEIIAIDPATPFTIESDGGQTVRLLGDFKPGTRYTLKLNAAPAGADRAKYPRAAQLAAFMPDRGSGVWFDNDQGYLSTAGNRALLVHAVNLDALRVSVTRMY
ncbi:MAG TPA: hypothetical protein VLI90_05015, partial [Tepidisphaeraceae bacterium]|nr:hypothetical protein [Tepidisphaeraceae bacterium]